MLRSALKHVRFLRLYVAYTVFYHDDISFKHSSWGVTTDRSIIQRLGYINSFGGQKIIFDKKMLARYRRGFDKTNPKYCRETHNFHGPS